MMIAIINMAFEEIKERGEQFKNKFELMDYITTSAKEMTGIEVAEAIVPEYLTKEEADALREEVGEEVIECNEIEEIVEETETTADEFTNKMDALLFYIKKTYLNENYVLGSDEDDEVVAGKRLLRKLNFAEHKVRRNIRQKGKELQFDAIFND